MVTGTGERKERCVIIFFNYCSILALHVRRLRYPSIDKRGNIFNNKFDFNSLSLYLSEIKPESVSRINGQVAEGDAATVPLVGGMGRI